MNTTTATPAQIDGALAALDERYVTAVISAVQAEQAAAKASAGRYASPEYAATLTARAATHRATAAAVAAEMEPLNAEFARRGGWTRAFIVAGGHVHSSQACSTCHKGALPTRFGWLTEFSGKTQAEVVEAAGSRACTVCYPDAPVDAPAGRLFHADEVAAQQARDERASKAAAKAEKRAANALSQPYRTSGRWSDKIETVSAAKTFLTDGAQWGWDHPSFLPVDRDAVAALLAEKAGTTAEAEVAAASKRAAKRR